MSQLEAHKPAVNAERLTRTVKLSLVLAYPILLGAWVNLHLGTIYAYVGAQSRRPSEMEIVAAYFTYLLVLVVVPNRTRRPTMGLYWTYYFVGIVPSSFFTIFSGEPSFRTVFITTIFVPCAYALVGQVFRMTKDSAKTVPLPPESRVRKLAVVCMVGVVSTCSLIVVLNPSAFIGWLQLSDVYERRDEYKAIGGSLPGLFYLIPWMSAVLSPYLVVVGRAYKWLDALLVGTAGLILTFLFTGQRGLLFRLASLLALAALTKRSGKLDYVTWSAATGGALVSTSWLLDEIAGSNAITALAVRLIHVPHRVSTRYFEYFGPHPFAFFSDGVPGKILGLRRYSLELPALIGREFFSGANANTGIVADGWANLGYLGIAIALTILSILLYVGDVAFAGLPLSIVSPLIAVRSDDFNNGATITIFVSGGIGLAFFILFLTRPYEKTHRHGYRPKPPSNGGNRVRQQGMCRPSPGRRSHFGDESRIS